MLTQEFFQTNNGHLKTRKGCDSKEMQKIHRRVIERNSNPQKAANHMVIRI